MLAACAPEVVDEPFEPSASHNDYSDALARLDLGETELGASWLRAADEAIADPVTVETPFEEVVLFDPSVPWALGYEFSAERGRAITISIDTDMERYFADLFRVDADDGPGRHTLVASRPDDMQEIRFEPRRDGVYRLRIQPELLRGGRFRVSIVATASLAFPVQGAGPGDIWSFYGDGRDGGLRRHEGIDIFAPRGTALLAASDALVARVGTRDRGGLIVTLYDEERDLLLYYAHLDEQVVRQGDMVRQGDVIGTVGNTGNAVTTPPHLHIGVYEGSWRSDVDPWPYFVDPPRVDPSPPQHLEAIGEWVRLREDTVPLRLVEAPEAPARWVNRNPLLRRAGAGDNPGVPGGGTALGDGASDSRGRGGSGDDSAAPPVPLVAGAPVRVVGGSGAYVRVRAASGEEGFVPAFVLDAERDAVVLGADRIGRDPVRGDAVAMLSSGDAFESIGTAGGRTYIELDDGRVVYVEG